MSCIPMRHALNCPARITVRTGTTVTYEYQNPGLPTTTLPADITVTFSGDGPTIH